MKLSCIPSAGLGLFALESFVTGDVICEYTGRQLRTVEALRQDTVSVILCFTARTVYCQALYTSIACMLVFPASSCVYSGSQYVNVLVKGGWIYNGDEFFVHTVFIFIQKTLARKFPRCARWGVWTVGRDPSAPKESCCPCCDAPVPFFYYRHIQPIRLVQNKSSTLQVNSEIFL